VVALEALDAGVGDAPPAHRPAVLAQLAVIRSFKARSGQLSSHASGI